MARNSAPPELAPPSRHHSGGGSCDESRRERERERGQSSEAAEKRAVRNGTKICDLPGIPLKPRLVLKPEEVIG